MDQKKIEELRDELEQLRGAKYNLKSSDLTRFAQKLGRYPANRGKEPTFKSNLPGRRPISIPGHRKVNPFTASSILDDFEEDIDALEEQLEAQRRANEAKVRPQVPPRALLPNRNPR
jgi:hypothetical protein